MWFSRIVFEFGFEWFGDEVSSYLLTYIPSHVNVVEEKGKKTNSSDILWHLHTFLKKISLELDPQLLIYAYISTETRLFVNMLRAGAT